MADFCIRQLIAYLVLRYPALKPYEAQLIELAQRGWRWAKEHGEPLGRYMRTVRAAALEIIRRWGGGWPGGPTAAGAASTGAASKASAGGDLPQQFFEEIARRMGQSESPRG